jgi:hypothetical protein
MKIRILLSITVVLLVSLMFVACADRSEKVRNGVMYATRALEQVNGNALARASYEGVIRNGGNAADYIKQTLPKKNPVFDSFEYGKPTHTWTIVIRPGSDPNDLSIEGYGPDLKRPLAVDSVKVNVPTE